MRSWDSLTIADQTLMRRAVSGYALAGMVQNYGVALRWAGAAGALPRSYTDDEQRALVPQLAAAALDLAGQGLLTVHEAVGRLGKAADAALAGEELREALTDPANWLFGHKTARRFALGAPRPVREQWFDDANPTADAAGLPAWDELSHAQREVLVCASEVSGMLTGPFGIWPDPAAAEGAAGLLEWIERRLDPLVPFIRDGLIEVQHHTDGLTDAYAVIPLEELRSALADPSIRYEGDDWGVGINCIFTYAGLAVWRAGWSGAWSERLVLD